MSTENTDTPTNYFLCDIDIPVGDKSGDKSAFDPATGLGKMSHVPLTHRRNPYPGLRGYTKRIITYPRADGVILSGTLYLPPGYDDTDLERPLLPLLMWAYPREFKSSAAASRLRDSPHRFSTISPTSPLVWLTRGYAVLEGPAMPVVAPEGGKPSEVWDEAIDLNEMDGHLSIETCAHKLGEHKYHIHKRDKNKSSISCMPLIAHITIIYKPTSSKHHQSHASGQRYLRGATGRLSPSCREPLLPNFADM